MQRFFHIALGITGAVVFIGGSLLMLCYPTYTLEETGKQTAAADPAAKVAVPKDTTPEPPTAEAPADSKIDEQGSVLMADGSLWTLEVLKTEYDRLVSANWTLEKQLTGILNWILQNFRGTVPLAHEQLAKLKFTTVTEDFTLHPDVAGFLRISNEKEAVINDAFTYTRMAINQAQLNKLTHMAPSPEQIILQIPPFPEEGENIRQDLYGALQSTLGDHRFAQFLEVSEDGLNNSFEKFGNGTRTIVFELVYDDADAPQFLINDGWTVEDEKGRLILHETEERVPELPEAYGGYAGAAARGFPGHHTLALLQPPCHHCASRLGMKKICPQFLTNQYEFIL